jgi:hypothetical protein
VEAADYLYDPDALDDPDIVQAPLCHVACFFI